MKHTPSLADLILENTIISLSKDENDISIIKFLGYFYYAESCENNTTPYRVVDYRWFDAPLSEVLKSGFSDYESENSDQYKQYIDELDEDGVIDAYNNYNNGKAPKPLLLSQLSENTPCGCYIILPDDFNENNILLKTLKEKADGENLKLTVKTEKIHPLLYHSMWYGGELARIEYRNYTFILNAIGDVYTHLANVSKDNNVFYDRDDVKDKYNTGQFFDVMSEYVNSDNELNNLFYGKYIELKTDDITMPECNVYGLNVYELIVENNNWWEITIINPDGTERPEGIILNNEYWDANLWAMTSKDYLNSLLGIEKEKTQISIDENHNIFITQNGKTVTISEDDIYQIANLSKRLYYKQDIVDYFKKNEKTYNIDALFNNTTLLDLILNEYENQRENSDFNDCAASQTECLDKALQKYQTELRQYKK